MELSKPLQVYQYFPKKDFLYLAQFRKYKSYLNLSGSLILLGIYLSRFLADELARQTFSLKHLIWKPYPIIIEES